MMTNLAQNQARITEILGTNDWLIHKATVAGTSYRHDIDRFNDGNWATIGARLEPEPTNQYDPTAIKVILADRRDGTEHHVGYVPRGLNLQIFMAVVSGTAVARFYSAGPAHTERNSPRAGVTLLILASFNPKGQAQLQQHWHQIAEFHRFTNPTALAA